MDRVSPGNFCNQSRVGPYLGQLHIRKFYLMIITFGAGQELINQTDIQGLAPRKPIDYQAYAMQKRVLYFLISVISIKKGDLYV